MQTSAVASGALGAAWVAPSVLGSATAFAAGTVSHCEDSQTLHWTDYLGSPVNRQEPTVGGTHTFTMKFDAVGANPDIWVKATVTAFSSNLTAAGGTVTPAYPAKGDNNGTSPNPTAGGINNYNTTGDNLFNGYSSYYQLCMKCTTQAGYTMTLGFYSDSALTTPINVYNLQFPLIDIDRQTPSNPYTDKVYLSDTSFTATLGSTVTGGGTSILPWLGTGGGGSTGNDSRVSVTYAGPINQFTFTYQATEFTSGYNQYIAIGDLTWC